MFAFTNRICIIAKGGVYMSNSSGKITTIEPIEVKCPKCGYTEIIYVPKEEIPKCPRCGTQMMISELLDEGKYY